MTLAQAPRGRPHSSPSLPFSPSPSTSAPSFKIHHSKFKIHNSPSLLFTSRRLRDSHSRGLRTSVPNPFASMSVHKRLNLREAGSPSPSLPFSRSSSRPPQAPPGTIRRKKLAIPRRNAQVRSESDWSTMTIKGSRHRSPEQGRPPPRAPSGCFITTFRELEKPPDAGRALSARYQHRLRSPDRTKLVVHPGLLARYNRMEVLGDLASNVGRSNGIYGLWLLIPANDQNDRPVLNHKAIPLSNPAQHVRLNRAWLANKHRA
jgi:hypothetical protein